MARPSSVPSSIFFKYSSHRSATTCEWLLVGRRRRREGRCTYLAAGEAADGNDHLEGGIWCGSEGVLEEKLGLWRLLPRRRHAGNEVIYREPLRQVEGRQEFKQRVCNYLLLSFGIKVTAGHFLSEAASKYQVSGRSLLELWGHPLGKFCERI